MKRLPLAALVVVLAAGCGAPAQRVVSNGDTTVVIVNVQSSQPASAAIDGNDPRIVAAGRVIAQQLAHPVRFEVDAALAAQFGSSLHTHFVSAMEATVSALAQAKKNPSLFAFVAPSFRTVSMVYRLASDEGRATSRTGIALDRATGVVRVDVSPRAEGLLGSYSLLVGLEDAYRAYNEERFRERPPESVAVGRPRCLLFRI